MQTSFLKYANTEVPRYTSYPTAVQFSAEIDQIQYRNWLQELPQSEPLSLYVHIPFCEQMCWYCGCHTNIVTGYQRIGEYLADLACEVTLVAAAMSEHQGPVAELHFGGGSPSLLSGEDFYALVAKLRTQFSFSSQTKIAVEIDPRTMNAAKAAAYAKASVTRVSLGVQDFNLHVQQKINRIQPPEMVRQVINWLKTAGIFAINFDLIYGLPTQSLDDIRRTIDLALEMQPDRFAVFGYAHVPWFKKHQQLIVPEDLPDTALRLQQADLVAELLTNAGYIRVGFDHYARADDALGLASTNSQVRRNFQGYTDDACDVLIGFGASSISALPQGYVQNDPQMGKWRQQVRAGYLPVVRGVGLRQDDKLRRAAIMQVLSQGQLDMAALCRSFDLDAAALDDALPKLAPLAQDGLLTLSNRRLQVTPDGIRFLRNIAACFDSYWQPAQKRHCLAV
ncbi:MAG: oxygen-independent coproporphyrinogen III oxidase [Robiginitomaculum sp.]|nr:oxygen-independent coproporphyrinogen III oxidase [Robiginitomaculum sp.]